MGQKRPVVELERVKFGTIAQRSRHPLAFRERNDPIYRRSEDQRSRHARHRRLGAKRVAEHPSHRKYRVGGAGDVLDAAVGADQDDRVRPDLRRRQRDNAGAQAQAEQHQRPIRKTGFGPLADGHRVLHEGALRRRAGALAVAAIVHQHGDRGALGERVDMRRHLLRVAAAIDQHRPGGRLVHDPPVQHRLAPIDSQLPGRRMLRQPDERLRVEDHPLLQRPQGAAQRQIDAANDQTRAQDETGEVRDGHWRSTSRAELAAA